MVNKRSQSGSAEASGEKKNQEMKLLAVREVARLLGVHVNTVRMWADYGILDSYRIGQRRDRRIPMEAVRCLLEIGRR